MRSNSIICNTISYFDLKSEPFTSGVADLEELLLPLYVGGAQSGGLEGPHVRQEAGSEDPLLQPLRHLRPSQGPLLRPLQPASATHLHREVHDVPATQVPAAGHYVWVRLGRGETQGRSAEEGD